MGVYTIPEIDKDFATVSKGVTCKHIFVMNALARLIITEAPDNEARDMSISNLLQAAEMLKCSIVMKAAETRKEKGGEA